MISEKIKSQGELHKGYIVGMSFLRYIDLCVDVYFDGEIHSVIDDSFINYYEVLCKRYSVNDSTVFINGIPVDVYIKKGNIYLDIDSVKKENL